MAAPTFLIASTGVTDAGGAWTAPGTLTGAVENDLIMFHLLQDGSAAGTVTLTTVSTGLKNLAGTAAAMTLVGTFQVGGTSLAIQHLWLGRLTNLGTSIQIDGANSGTDDIYARFYAFQNVSAGTTLATVIENGSAGGTNNQNGTSSVASGPTVTTLGVDRTAVALTAINDDNPFAGIGSASGGSWSVVLASYAESTGTDAAMYLQTAAMPTAGTISGGTGSITDSDAWGVLGFALIGTTPDVARVPRSTPYPQLLAHARAYKPRRKFTFLDGLWRPDRRLVLA